MTGIVVTFRSLGEFGQPAAVAETGVLLASWGYRVLCVDWRLDQPPLADDNDDPPTDSPSGSVLGPPRDMSREVTRAHPIAPGGFLGLTAVQHSPSGFDRSEWQPTGRVGRLLEERRSRWIAEYDVVLVDGPPLRHAGLIPTHQLPDVMVLLVAADRAALRTAQDVVDVWAFQRDTLPYDRSRLLVVPVPVSTEEPDGEPLVVAPSVATAAGPMCRNWLDRGVPAGRVLDRIARRHDGSVPDGDLAGAIGEVSAGAGAGPSAPLAALLAHRCGRTDLLAESVERYVSSVRRDHRRAGFHFDLVLAHDVSDRRVAKPLYELLTAEGLRVRRVPGPPADESFADETLDRLGARDACVLLGSRLDFWQARFAERFDRQGLIGAPDHRVVAALLPAANTMWVDEPLRSSEWVRLDEDPPSIARAARQITALLSRGASDE
jgi:hypothetical protein